MTALDLLKMVRPGERWTIVGDLDGHHVEVTIYDRDDQPRAVTCLVLPGCCPDFVPDALRGLRDDADNPFMAEGGDDIVLELNPAAPGPAPKGGA